MFTRCWSCHGVFWLEDAAYVGDMPYETQKRPGWFARLFGANEPPEISENWRRAFPIEPPDIDAIVVGIETMSRDVTKAMEQRHRRLLWWKLNDRDRSERRAVHSVSRAIIDTHEENNLLRLLELSIDEGAPTIETVEILRELGRFDESRLVLERVDQNTTGLEIIAKKIAVKDSRVCVIQESDYLRSNMLGGDNGQEDKEFKG